MLGVLLVLLGVVAVGWCVAVGRVDRTSSVGPLLLWIKLKAMVVVVVVSLCRVSVWCLLNSFGCHAF